MLLSNSLFDPDAILNELREEILKERPTLSAHQAPELRKQPSALVRMQGRLKKHYFPSCSHQQIQTILGISQESSGAEESPFDEFPRLKYVLQRIFSLAKDAINPQIPEIPNDLQDWHPTIIFADINQKYGYFEEDLSLFFQQLAIACRKMTKLIEQQAYDDEMAYKLMALFYDIPSKLENAMISAIRSCH